MLYISFNLRSFSSYTELTGNKSLSTLQTNDTNFSAILSPVEQFEQIYNTAYKPLIKLINKNPNFNFSFSLNGTFISYLKKRRKEFITLLRQLQSNKQIEIIGGGYYDPVMPLLLSLDRNGQIDKLSAEIRQTIGNRPRGITLCGDIWDSSLVNSLEICGIEYVLLEDSIIPVDKKQFLPLIMNDLGKSIEIFPTYSQLKPKTDISPERYIDNLLNYVNKETRKSNYVQFEPNRIINIDISIEELQNLISVKWFETFIDYLNKHPELPLQTTTVQLYKKSNNTRIPAYISNGMNSSLKSLVSQKKGNSKYTYTVYDFMETFPLCKNLYNRSLYIGMLINQYKKDKMRKLQAREKLWQAQNGIGLLIFINNSFIPTCFRQKSYKDLLEAEKIIRDDESFKESFSRFDYNGDGLNDYICRMKNYFSYISPVSGAIQELEILKASGNYADNLCRTLNYDNFDDNYERGIFIDHLFDKNQLKLYTEGKPAGDGIFSRIIYSELKFSQNHRELQFEAYANFGKSKQKIYLRKKYIINSDGMNIQYIIRNESDKKLEACFAVESNLAHTNFIANQISYFDINVVSDNSITKINSEKNSAEQNLNTSLSNIDLVRITDSDSGIYFVFEPNESCSYVYYPLIFKRPDFTSTLTPVHLTFVSTLYWNLNLEPGHETEKNINFTITNIKKSRNSKNS